MKKIYVAPEIEFVYCPEELCDMGAVFSNTADPEEFGAKKGGGFMVFEIDDDLVPDELDAEDVLGKATWGNLWVQ